MSYKVKVNLEGVPKDAPVTIKGLPALTNGKTTEVSDEDAEAYRRINQVTNVKYNKKGQAQYVTELGPELSELNVAGVEVTGGTTTKSGKGGS